MLHEIFDGAVNTTTLPLSLSEEQLLASVKSLSQTHQRLRHQLDSIIDHHDSVICQATATSIRQVQLERFQDAILETENGILTKDSALVGAYDIVPLALIVGKFDVWHRRLAYLWEIAKFMGGSTGHRACSGAELINKLRNDAHTGYIDLEGIATELSRVAETAWLRQLATWLLYGTISISGRSDFFIAVHNTEDGTEAFEQRHVLLPQYVTSTTATKILFIGRTLAQIARNISTKKIGSSADLMLDTILADHTRIISSIALPISEQQLSRVTTELRASISRNVLQHLLPPQQTETAMSCLQRYFLLRDKDFASCLIEEADRKKDARWHSMDRTLAKDPLAALKGLSLEESEVEQILRQTWKQVSMNDHQDEDEILDFAQKQVTFTASRRRPLESQHSPGDSLSLSATPFNDLLLPVPTTLAISIPGPLSLLISDRDTQNYSTIQAYLLALYRARSRVCGMWRLSHGRRQQVTNAHSGPSPPIQLIRQCWATCSSALFFLSELMTYIDFEVLTPACEDFRKWTVESTTRLGTDSSSAREDTIQRDPESLAAAHRVFVEAIAHAILITDVAYTKDVRAIIGLVDHLIALFPRVLEMQSTNGPGGHLPQVQQLDKEDNRTFHELQTICQRIGSGLESVIDKIQRIDQNRSVETQHTSSPRASDDYVPRWTSPLDRLLIRLRFESGSDDVDEDDHIENSV